MSNDDFWYKMYKIQYGFSTMHHLYQLIHIVKDCDFHHYPDQQLLFANTLLYYYRQETDQQHLDFIRNTFQEFFHYFPSDSDIFSSDFHFYRFHEALHPIKPTYIRWNDEFLFSKNKSIRPHHHILWVIDLDLKNKNPNYRYTRITIDRDGKRKNIFEKKKIEENKNV